MLVVGWGTEKRQKYWLVKNSWGFGWGSFGFIKIRRGTRECNIGDECIVAKCYPTAGPPDPAPESAPPQPQVPVDFWCDVTALVKSGDVTGTIDLRAKDRSQPGQVITSTVRCRNSKCTPSVPGPSNACMYICGAMKCK